MRSLVPVGHFRNISGHLFTWLVCASFRWRHGLFTDCIVWDDKDKMIGFKRSHWIHLGWWSTGSTKLQLFQLSQHSHITHCRMISSSATFHEIWRWNTKCSYLKVPKIIRKKIFFLAVCLSKRYTQVPEVVFATSLSRLPRKVNNPFGTTP